MRIFRKKSDPGINAITEGVIWKQLLVFFFPILLGSLFQQLYNTVDALIVGNFVSKEALAAVGGSTGPLINLIVGFFIGFGAGGAVIVSQYFGAKRADEVSRAVHTSIALAVIGGAFISFIGIAFAPLLLEMMNTPEGIMDYAVTYLRIYFAGMIPMSLYNIGAGIIQATGDSRRPLYYLVAASIVNIVLDLVFVILLDMGVSGVALATLIAQTVSAVLTLATLLRTSECYRLVPRKIRIHRDVLGKITCLGIPRGFQSTLYSFANVLIQSAINAYGTDVVAAWTAYGKLDALYSVIVGSMGVAVTTFVGQNFGAGKIDRVHKSVKTGYIICLLITIASIALALPFGSHALRIFIDDPAVIAFGVDMIWVMFPGFLFYIGIEVFPGALQGAGDSLRPTLMTLLGACVVRVTWITLIANTPTDIQFTLLCYPISWGLTTLMFVFYYFKGNWIERCRAKMGFH